MNGETTFRKAITAFAALAFTVYAGWLGSNVLGIGDRLKAVETTIAINSAERAAQLGDIRTRLQRLEEAYWSRRPTQ